MERKKTLVILIVVSFIIMFAGMVGTMVLLSQRKANTYEDFFNVFISITSFILSFLAFCVAVKTYISIDSVDSATAMEGNILENTHYSVEYVDLLKTINGNTHDDVVKKLKAALNKKHRYHNTIEFANHLQRTIDCLVLLRLIDVSGDVIYDEYHRFVLNVVLTARHFESISSGLEYVFGENLKLIFSVMRILTEKNLLNKKKSIRGLMERICENRSYSLIKKKHYDCEIYNVRGKMLLNPISQIAYYDYMAIAMIKSMFGCKLFIPNDDCESFPKQFISKQNLTEEAEVTIVLEKAQKCLESASSLSEGNFLWSAIIQDDLLQVDIIRWHLKGDTRQDISDLRKRTEKVLMLWNEAEVLFKLARDNAPKENSYLNDVIGNRRNQLEELSAMLKKEKKLIEDGTK